MKIELLNVLNKEEHKLVKGYQVAKNNVIFHEGDVCETIGIIISGKVDIISYSFEGKESALSVLPIGNNQKMSRPARRVERVVDS